MIEHFQAIVRGDAKPRRSPADSVAVLSVLDLLRDAAGLVPVPFGPAAVT